MNFLFLFTFEDPRSKIGVNLKYMKILDEIRIKEKVL